MKPSMRASLLCNVLLAIACVTLLLQQGSDEEHSLGARLASVPVKNLAVLGGPSLGAEFAIAEQAGAIEVFAAKVPFVTRRVERAHPLSPPSEVIARLEAKKAEGATDHFGYLLEYGLRVHLGYLVHTKLARELPLDSNLMLAELVRLAGIDMYATAHEAGWLNKQFQGPFVQTGYSSYQIHIWAKEHWPEIMSDDKRFPNRQRIVAVLDAIDTSSRNGVGGGNPCHYGCL